MTSAPSVFGVVPRRLAAAAEGGSSLRTADVGEVLLVCGIGAAVGFVAGLALTLGLRWLGRRLQVSLDWTAATRSPVVALCVVIAVKVVLELAEAQHEWADVVVRVLDVGIFASAGVVGIVFGLAAQTSLANIFAGIQIAFTDGIRIDDIVDIEGQWGRIEETTVEDASGPVMTLVAEGSSPDGDSLAPLRREVREGPVEYIQRGHTDAVPRARTESTTRLVAPDDETIERLVGARDRLVGASSVSAHSESRSKPQEES
jgi:hypothetical protein